MKNIYAFAILAFFLLAACENGKKDTEVYSAFDENYLSEEDVDKKPTFADNEKYTDLLNQIGEDLDNYKEDNEITNWGSGNFDAYLFVNREGSVDKVFVIEAPNQEIINIISEKLMKFKFAPGEKEGKPTASRYKFHYNLYTGSNLDATYFVAVEQMPAPVGGIQSIGANVNYPEIAKRAGIQGRVFVKAYIDTSGNVVRAEIIKGIGSGCDEAAIEAVKKSKFTPGMQRGKKVNVQVSIPILFKLD